MHQLQRRPWLAGFVVGLPIAVVSLVAAAFFLGPGSLINAGPVRGPAAAIGTLVASSVLAELAAHRHVRPLVAIIAWIATAHAMATVIIIAATLVGTEANTLMVAAGVLFGFVLVVALMGIPWFVGGLAWWLAVRQIVGTGEPGEAAAPVDGPTTPPGPTDAAQDAAASTTPATTSGS